MQPEQAADVRRAYLHVFDQFATDPVTMSDALGINPRYARELLAVLTTNDLTVIDQVNGEEDVWQTYPDTYDTITRDEAETRIDRFLAGIPTGGTMPTATPTKPATKTEKVQAQKIEFKHCLCGCGENVPPKSNFRPGHDARMAGQIGRKFIADGDIDNELLQTLPTEPLRDKAMLMFTKHLDKQRAKTAAKVAAAAETVSKVEPAKAEAPKPTAPVKKAAAKKASKGPVGKR